MGVDEDPASGITGDRRVRRVPTPDETQIEVEIGDHMVGQQGDQIRIARQPCRDTGEHLRRDRGTADVIRPFEHQHPTTRPREEGGGGQSVVAGSDDDVVVGAHAHTLASIR